MRHTIIAVVIALVVTACSVTGQTVGLTRENLFGAKLLFLELVDSMNVTLGSATGILLWNYSVPASPYILTATHVVKNAYGMQAYLPVRTVGYQPLYRQPFAIRDSSGEQTFWTFKEESGSVADIAVVIVPPGVQLATDAKLVALSRSALLFEDSILIGTKLLATGYADPSVFTFIEQGAPLAVGGVVAFRTEKQYVMDQRTHHGMSGGVVFAESPVFGDYVYRVAGVVSAGLSRYPDYTWVTKIDYLDSVFVQHTGHRYGEEKK